MRYFFLSGPLAAAFLAACSSARLGQGNAPAVDAGSSSMPSIDTDAGGVVLGKPLPVDLGATCDASRSVKSDGAALLVRDAETLSRFSLERVLAQIIATAGATITPPELLQRLFDTENTTASGVFGDNVHCDDPDNGAFKQVKAVDCP